MNPTLLLVVPDVVSQQLLAERFTQLSSTWIAVLKVPKVSNNAVCRYVVYIYKGPKRQTLISNERNFCSDKPPFNTRTSSVCFWTVRNPSVSPTRSAYLAVLEHLVHVDALCVEDHLLFSALCRGFGQQAASQTFGLHDDGVLGQSGHDRSQVEVHLPDWQHQVNLRQKKGPVTSWRGRGHPEAGG